MKAAIPLGAVLLVGIAAGIHPAFVGPAGPDRRPPAGREQPELDPSGPEAKMPSAEAELPGGVKQPEATVERPAPDLTWRKLSLQLERGLGLAELQKSGVQQILRDRDQEIRSCHDAIRKAGVLDMRHYEWQVGLMKAAWYRKIDTLLDAAQHEQFVRLVEQGFFNDGLAFSYEPGMTVLE